MILTKEIRFVCPEYVGEDGFKETNNCNWTVQSVVKNYPQLVQDDFQTGNDAIEIQNDDVTQESETSIEEHTQEGSYVSAIYDNVVYIGKVLERDDTEKEMSISVMQKGKLEGHYRWPQTEDTIWIEF